MRAEKSNQSDSEFILEEAREIIKIVNPVIADGFALYEKLKIFICIRLNYVSAIINFYSTTKPGKSLIRWMNSLNKCGKSALQPFAAFRTRVSCKVLKVTTAIFFRPPK